MIAQMQLNKKDTNEHEKVNGEKPTRPQPYTNSYRQLKKAENRKGGLPKGRAHKLVVWVPSGQSQHVWTEQIIFENVCVHTYLYTYMHALIISFVNIMNLKQSREGQVGGLGRWKRKRELSQLDYNLKNK